MANADTHFVSLNVFLTDLNTDWGSTQFPGGVFEPGVVIVCVVQVDPDASILQVSEDLVTNRIDLLKVVALLENRDNHHLRLGHSRGQHHTLVV